MIRRFRRPPADLPGWESPEGTAELRALVDAVRAETAISHGYVPRHASELVADTPLDYLPRHLAP
ncbi:hypothetical protein Acy02nite_68730 [Actinoplanes cyaneus]|uniref:Uncharacterized protein n=1 Tax=Actinoplanes cyaneus TaxID=52696 RepID=A0A919M7P3_9ACTN|nr:hypothetical protein [Actinoplanes cyaneus]MCW2139078.1 hypothetical protein [Actinoplanes cyaneus]GID68992.1 hypothetical protein Acy02nite_68730 [Actinoplanes cyaneus]